MLDHLTSSGGPRYADDREVASAFSPIVSEPLRIGLLNNMPDAALVATERQFRRLIGANVALSLFSLDNLPRNPAARAHLDKHYASHLALPDARLDALVITGCEPRAGRLDAEPWFSDFAAIVDWAGQNTVSTLFSCLAAHAAVKHLDGIERQRLPAKYSGVFKCERAISHPLLAGMAATVSVPHSRWNDLPERDLAAHGYKILRRSPEIGVDLFVRDAGSLFVFLQGHPEYDPDTLAREYRRDLGRFLDRDRDDCPNLPENYYGPQATARLASFAELARTACEPGLRSTIPSLESAPPRRPAWREPASRLFRNWLVQVEMRRATARLALRSA